MRILDQDTDKSLKNILILLTQAEATELRDDLDRMLLQKIVADHSHINDIEYEREITMALYANESLDNFNERSKKLIVSGE